MIDQVLNGAPPQGWPSWMDTQIAGADFILVVCTETYFNRVTGLEQRGKGKGVKWESLLLQQEIYDRDSLNPKVVPVHFGTLVETVIPRWLRPVSRYRVDEETGYEKLFRFLKDQPLVPMPDLGPDKTYASKTPNPLFPNPSAQFPQMPPHNLPQVSLGVRFVGREMALSQLKDALARQGALAVTQPQVLSGLGGIGKSRLALEYA